MAGLRVNHIDHEALVLVDGVDPLLQSPIAHL